MLDGYHCVLPDFSILSIALSLIRLYSSLFELLIPFLSVSVYSNSSSVFENPKCKCKLVKYFTLSMPPMFMAALKLFCFTLHILLSLASVTQYLAASFLLLFFQGAPIFLDYNYSLLPIKVFKKGAAWVRWLELNSAGCAAEDGRQY